MQPDAEDSTDNVVLVVEDDQKIRSILARYLSHHEFAVREAGSGSEMWQELTRQMPDIVLLDLGLPDVDGLSLLRELRQNTKLGIIIVSGMADQVDRVVGLELGADDYVAKPIDYRELLARIRSVRRRLRVIRGTHERALRANRLSSAVLHFDGWRLDTDARSLTNPEGSAVNLTTMEFDTLRLLAEHPGTVMTRENLLRAAANRDWDPFDRAIDTVVVKLRRKLGEDPRAPRLIKTIRGVGYLFAAKVTQ